MKNNEEYNGWKNRETWAMNLWLTNDEYICNELMPRWERESENKYDCGRRIEEWVEEESEDYFGSTNHKTFLREVGSMWRVEWGDIADSNRRG